MASFAGYSGAILEPWQEIDAKLSTTGCKVGAPTLGGTTGGKHAPGSKHYSKEARDYGDATNDCVCIFRALEPYASGPDHVISELFYNPIGYYYDDGVKHQGTIDDNHWGHVHVAIVAGRHFDGAVAGAAASTMGLGGLAAGVGAIPIIDDALGAIKDLPGALIEAILGMPVPEFAIRTIELIGGAILMAVGLIMFLRVLSRANAAQGVKGAGKAGRQLQRAVRIR